MDNSLIRLIELAISVYTFLIIARVLLSWVPHDPANPVVGLLYRLTEPVMAPVRNLLPQMGGIDFSPIAVIFGLQLLKNLVVSLLIRMG